MITSSRHDEWKKRKRRRLLSGLFAVSLVVLLVRGPVADSLGGVLFYLGTPVWALEESVSGLIERTRVAFAAKERLADENRTLRAALDEVAIEAHARDALREENRELKEMLGRRSEFDLMYARILSAPPVSPYDTLLVDIGEEDGVASGTPVFSQGDWKVGEVTRLWRRSALVTLYSAPGTEVSVMIGTSSIPAKASGIGGGNLRAILPRGISIKEGDLVTIPAIDPSYAGTVDAIERPEGSSLEAIYMRLPFDLTKERHVYLAFPKGSVVRAGTP